MFPTSDIKIVTSPVLATANPQNIIETVQLLSVPSQSYLLSYSEVVRFLMFPHRPMAGSPDAHSPWLKTFIRYYRQYHVINTPNYPI